MWFRLEWSRVELYQVIQRKIARRASARVANTRPWRHSRLSDPQYDSATASKHVATRPTEVHHRVRVTRSADGALRHGTPGGSHIVDHLDPASSAKAASFAHGTEHPVWLSGTCPGNVGRVHSPSDCVAQIKISSLRRWSRSLGSTQRLSM